MTVWETLKSQSADLLGTAAGTALDAYSRKLLPSQNVTPTSPAPEQATFSTKWLVIAAVAIVGLIAFVAFRRK
jgi:hypothetical protein